MTVILFTRLLASVFINTAWAASACISIMAAAAAMIVGLFFKVVYWLSCKNKAFTRGLFTPCDGNKLSSPSATCYTHIYLSP